MTLLEAGRVQRNPQKQRRKLLNPLDRPHSAAHPNQILSFFDWCALNNISTRTGRRIIARGEGPPVIRMSKNRIGITNASNAAWQQSRERA